MAFNYSEAQTTALDLITEFGQAGTLTEASAGTLDPVTGIKTGSTDSTQSILVALLPVNEKPTRSLNDESFIQDLVLGKISTAYISPVDAAGVALVITPEPGNKLTANGEDYEIIGKSELNPAGTVVLYTCMVRK